jgi:hypothetical protein
MQRKFGFTGSLQQLGHPLQNSSAPEIVPPTA